VKRIHLLISGFVHGVGFRYNAQRKARLADLTGYSRNLSDGTVEIEVQGTPEALDRFIHWAHHGPANAQVDSLRQHEMDIIESESGFEIR
jgi:acylphosphatase